MTTSKSLNDLLERDDALLEEDEEGNVLICDPGLGRIFVLDKRGVPVKQIKGPTEDAFLTNCTFGGPDGKTLYITSSLTGQVLKVEWRCKGAVPIYNKE